MIEDPLQISFPVVRVRQPIGDFFIGSVRAKDLFRICYFDIRRIWREDGIDTYLGVQRELSERRVREINEYAHTRDATFPTAVILAVDQRCAVVSSIDPRLGVEEYDEAAEEAAAATSIEPTEEAGEDVALTTAAPASDEARFMMLTLRNVPEPEPGEQPVLFRQIARVLDGQHRIAGLEGYGGPEFEINVAIFIGLDLPMQANIFSVVNLAQTKVNKSLVYDLYAYDRARFPEKTCHDLAVALNDAPSSPFYGLIKRLGVAERGRFGQTLSQATFVEALLPYISQNVSQDREMGRRGKRWALPTAQEAERLIFRPMFVEERDVDIASTLWDYFGAVKRRWPAAWEWTGSGRILNKSTGFNGLMRFLRPAYLHFVAPGELVPKGAFDTLFEKTKLESDDFTTENFKPGSSGVSHLYRRLLEETDLAV